VSVHFATANGTASAGQDFTAAGGTLSWADGDTAPKPVTVQLLNPATIGAAKTFTIALTSPLNGSLGALASTTVTIKEPPFAAWQFARFGANANVASIGGANADTDHDGFENLLEYAGNTDPSDTNSAKPAALFPEVALDGQTYLTIIYTRRLPPRDVTYHVETSTDLATWSESPLDIAELGATDDGNSLTQTVKTRATAPVTPGAQRYLRLRVTQP
jgi:hypothetical protein